MPSTQRRSLLPGTSEDARALADLDEHFDTVLDCGLFHVLGDTDQERYVRGLTEMVPSGGRFHMLCLSDRQPGDWGLTWNPEGALAWLVTATRH